MAYLDNKIRTLVKAQVKVTKAAAKVSYKRQVAHNNIERTIARAILKGGYLSQEVWTLPSDWTDNMIGSKFSLRMYTSAGKSFKKRWGNILEYMEKYSYRVELAPSIYLTYRAGDGIDLSAGDQKDLATFARKHGMQIVCPEVDEVVDHLENKLAFVKGVRESLQSI